MVTSDDTSDQKVMQMSQIGRFMAWLACHADEMITKGSPNAYEWVTLCLAGFAMLMKWSPKGHVMLMNRLPYVSLALPCS
jgi:hypothetical protein